MNKEQKAKIAKEQSKKVDSYSIIIGWPTRYLGACPSCGSRLEKNYNTNFCGECGQRITWENGNND